MSESYPGYLLPAKPTTSHLVVPWEWARFHFMAALANSLGWQRGVEIGVSYGTTIDHLLEYCPQLTMYGVDTWELNPEALEPSDWDQSHHLRAYEAAQAVAEKYPGRAILVKSRSDIGLGPVEPGSLDFVWIDGDHGTEAVIRDIQVWMSALKPTGWLLGHDINWPTVRSAVDQLVPGYMIAPDNVWFRPLHPRPGWWANQFGSGFPKPTPPARIIRPRPSRSR